jgi:hypothetical protein
MLSFRMALPLTLLVCAFVTAATSSGAHAQSTVVLYSNDFETPNVPIQVNCGNSLDARGINFLYGSSTFMFAQTFTVEAVMIHDPSNLYRDPSGIGGNVALGMLSTFQDDHLFLTFNAQHRPFLNVGFHLSSIDVSGCGGPFGVDVPIMSVSLMDTMSGAMLDRGTVTGTASPGQFTFDWRYGVVSLSASSATTATVTVVFDLLQSGYAAFDNLSITASSTTGVVDRDLDTIPDDRDNCPMTANMDQANTDLDLAGDVCDPAPNDPTICGDRDMNGIDDCAPPDGGVIDAGAATDAAASPDATEDAATAPDSTASDTGTSGAIDARPAGDAQMPAAADGGSGADTDGGPSEKKSSGCSCGVTSPARGELLFGAILFIALAARKRR